MTRDQFLNLKVGNKLRKIGRTEVYTVVNNDPQGTVFLLPGRRTGVAYRVVHPETWEFDPDQSEGPRELELALREIERLRKLLAAYYVDAGDPCQS